MPIGKCPECEADVQVANGKADLHDLIDCLECNTELEIVSLDPLELDYYEEEYEEDFDDEDDDEY